MHRHLIAPAVILTVGLVVSGTAFAHAHLKSAMPPVDGTVQTAPAEVAVEYSETVEPRFSTIEVRDASGARVDTGNVHTAPGDGKRLVVGLKPLPAGTYMVTWQATATDTHKVKGNYSFTVGR